MILRILNYHLGKKWFPVSFRLMALVVFVVLVFIGFSSPTKHPVFVNQLSKINLTTSFVWRLWWPLIVLSSIFLGRVWCMICPVEMVTTLFAKIGLKRKRPKWILSGWGITLFYFFVLTVGITIFELDANPMYTSYYLLTIMGISMLSGLVFEKNTFCRYFCPVGYLLGIFSKMAFWGWRVKDKSICRSCTDKSCVKSDYTYQLNEKSCGVDLYPAHVDNNSHCLLCAGCLKTCKKYTPDDNSLRPNPGIVKIGFAQDLMQGKPMQIAEWFFLFLLTGSMIFEMTHFQIVYGVSLPFASGNISSGLHLSEGILKDVTEVFYLYFLLPSILWVFPYILLSFFAKRVSVRQYLQSISNIFIPVIASFFVGLVFMEVVTKLPYYKYIIRDPGGVETVKAMLFRQIEMPQMPGWSEWVFSAILILLIVLGIIFSFRVIHKLAPKMNLEQNEKLLFALPVVFIVILYAEALAYQLF
ncbi:4Fe-4S binding protein [Mariniphaga sediminis]|uniref:4Fe-4S binding protein n=1 Tax=Mariniphaga sediminis TaxID=1628158 RepID=UPI003563C683